MRWFIFSICFFCLTCARSQSPYWQKVDLGLESVVLDVEMDSLGFLWFLSDSVLYRFDGQSAVAKYRFEMFAPQNISVSQDHNFLLGTADGKVLEFNPYVIDLSQKASLSDTISIQSTCQQEDFCLLGTSGQGVAIPRADSLTWLVGDPILNILEIYDIEYWQDSYYVASDQGILKVVCSSGHCELDSLIGMDSGLPDFIITKLLADGDRLWFADFDKHLSYIEGAKMYSFSFPTASKINDLTMHQGVMYVARDKGVYALKGDSLSLIYEPENNEKLLHLIKDEENNLWLVNSDGAFLKANLRIQKFDLNIAGIRAIEYWNGKLYLGLEYGLYRYEKGKLQMLNSYNVTSLCHNDDYLFVGTFSDGIQILDRQERQLQNIDGWMGIENESILYLYCNSSQQLYASSLTGVVRIDLSGAMENMTIESLNDILGPNYIYSIHHNSGRYYFGTDGRGLIEWDPVSGEVNHRMTFNNDSKLGSVYSMASDDTNRVWFTSSELGLLCLDDGELTRLDLKHSLTDEYTSIHSLSDGKIILIRAKSIDVLEPSLGHIMYYDTEVGLSEEVAFLNCATRHDAFSYFVHDQSIYAYNPSDFQKIHPEIIIDDVLVNFSPLNWRQDLSQNENNLEFRYSASWLTDPLKLSYQYKLEGLDSDWKFTGDRSVSYSKLNPGKYEFKVRASENRAFHDEPEAEFSFEIKRFLYNTLWFRMLAVLLVLLLFWQWRNYIDRQKQLRLAADKQNVESQLISLRNQLNPHFLFNSFNTLLGLIEEGDTVKSSSFVENLSDFYRMILDYGKNELSTFENEYELAQLYVSLLNERFDGAIQLKHDDEIPTEILMPTLSLQLLIENAIKHNEFNAQNPLRINIEFSESSLSVINNKSPKKYEVKSTGSGLSNIKKRYLLLFGKGIEVINNDSYFKVLLPVEQGRS